MVTAYVRALRPADWRGVVLAIVLAPLAGCGAPASAPSTLAADEAAIADFNRRYLQSINDADIDTLASLTTENHMMISGGRAPLVGKQALVDAMNRVFARFEIDETWVPEETVISGELAYQRGTYVVEATPKAGGERTRSTGIFNRIYRRQPDGTWLMTRDILSRDAAPQ